MTPNFLTAAEAAAAIRRGEMTAVDLMTSCLEAIAAREEEVGAFAWFDPERALAEARDRDLQGATGPLHGVPFGVKDIIDAVGMPTECNSPIYRGYMPARDAACVAMVRAAGAVIIGKTVTTEFAHFTPGRTRNPHNPAHTPGGSSSGSGAGVAAGMFHLAFGTQTGGSVIRPAAFCGIWGFKPTFNLVSREGVKPLADSFDTVGWYGRSAADLALVLAVLTRREAPDPAAGTKPSYRVGLCRTPMWHMAEPATRAAVERAASALAGAGHAVEEVELPAGWEGLWEDHLDMMALEAGRGLIRERSHHWDLLSEKMREALERGFAVAPEKEIAIRHRFAAARQHVDGLFDTYDVLLTPSAPGEAPEGIATTGNAVFNRLWTMLGTPCVTIPAGMGPEGLPVGIQLVGRRNGDFGLLATAERTAALLPG